jgi:beta-galactosidase
MLGSVTGHGTQINQTVTLMAGTNDIVFLSMTTGLQDSGAFLEQEQAGILNAVTLEGLPSGVRDLTQQLWTYQVLLPL